MLSAVAPCCPSPLTVPLLAAKAAGELWVLRAAADSSIGWTEPAPFYECLDQSIDMYDRNEIQGFYVFAGSVLQSMNASLWKNWDLRGHLKQSYFPYQGGMTVTVNDAATGKPIGGATASVIYNGTTHVTRRKTPEPGDSSSKPGQIRFGGWTGKASPATHTIKLSASGYQDTVVKAVQLQAGVVMTKTVTMTRSVAADGPLKTDDELSVMPAASLLLLAAVAPLSADASSPRWDHHAASTLVAAPTLHRSVPPTARRIAPPSQAGEHDRLRASLLAELGCLTPTALCCSHPHTSGDGLRRRSDRQDGCLRGDIGCNSQSVAGTNAAECDSQQR